ncbi:MAG: hypothetical protein IJS90_01935 [Clostridia bacterium]|nr:hypothetical protein [Clostridia bacterium]
MKKLFGKLEISWWKLVLFAVICGVYTGVMALIPMARDTSFQDITMTFEWWILFAIIIIVNSKTPLDSALKVFVFFLISQPLVYLVQVPFSPEGFGLFRYYPSWFKWTLLTFPMAFVGHYMKKDKWWGLVILAPMLVFLGYHYYNFFGEAVHFFPNHLLSAIFCAATMIIYPLFIFSDKKIRIIGVVFSVVVLLAATIYGFVDGRSHAYDTSLLLSGSETCGFEYDDSYSVYLTDEGFGEVSIEYEEAIESYLVRASFTNTGDTELVLVSPQGEETVYDLHVERYSYTVRRKE